MMDWIMGYVPEWNGWLALLLFWMPLVLCLYTYLLRTVKDYRNDLDRREDCDNEGGHYSPTLTVGKILGRVLAAVTPIVNLFAAVFDAAPEAFSDFFGWLGRVFDQPLVPRRRS